jgi:hypothetical protein
VLILFMQVSQASDGSVGSLRKRRVQKHAGTTPSASAAAVAAVCCDGDAGTADVATLLGAPGSRTLMAGAAAAGRSTSIASVSMSTLVASHSRHVRLVQRAAMCKPKGFVRTASSAVHCVICRRARLTCIVLAHRCKLHSRQKFQLCNSAAAPLPGLPLLSWLAAPAAPEAAGLRAAVCADAAGTTASAGNDSTQLDGQTWGSGARASWNTS